MAVVKRMVVPPGKNKATVEEYFDTDIGRVVPKPAEPEAAVEAPTSVIDGVAAVTADGAKVARDNLQDALYEVADRSAAE